MQKQFLNGLEEKGLDLDAFLSYLTEIENRIPNQNNVNDIISAVLIGPARTGKSTISKTMKRSQPLQVRKNDGNYNIVGEGISNQTQAFDIYPNKYEITFSNGQKIILWDTPGYGDNTGLTQNIKNAYSIHRLFYIHERVKIILVFPYYSLLGLASDLFQTLQILVDTFEQIPQLKENLGFLITQVPHSQVPSDVQSFIKNRILPSKENVDMTPKVKDILTQMATSKNFLIMNQPTKEYENAQLCYQQFRKDFEDLIIRTNSINQPHAKIKLNDQYEKSLIRIKPEIKEKVENSFKLISDAVSGHFLSLHNPILPPLSINSNLGK